MAGRKPQTKKDIKEATPFLIAIEESILTNLYCSSILILRKACWFVEYNSIILAAFS